MPFFGRKHIRMLMRPLHRISKAKEFRQVRWRLSRERVPCRINRKAHDSTVPSPLLGTLTFSPLVFLNEEKEDEEKRE